MNRGRFVRTLALVAASFAPHPASHAGDLVVEVQGSPPLSLVGVVRRFDDDGQLRAPVDPNAAIESPHVDARAQSSSPTRHVFRNLPAGRYDLVLIAAHAKMRLEGFHYPPITELDPTWPGDSPAPDADARDAILNDVAASRHHENKVAPLALATDDRAQDVRILMQLVRDLPTSLDADAGHPVATVRHEFWQYHHRYGSWSKDKRTVVLDRVLLPADDWKRWTWAWSPTLGGIEIDEGKAPAEVKIGWPTKPDPSRFPGWWPEGK